MAYLVIETSAAQVKVLETARVTTLASSGQAGTWLIDPKDFTIASVGGDFSGASISSALGGGNVSILSSGGGTVDGNGDINVNEAVSWNANTLTLTAARDININAVMTASGTAALTMNTSAANGADAAVAGGLVRTGFGADGAFRGRVDFGARTGTGFLTINGNGYTVINAMGARSSMSTTDLQGMNGNLAGFYALGANVDAGNSFFETVGFYFLPFTGKFNGLGHTVSNLRISSFNSSGFFGRTNGASIGNVGLVNSTFSADTDAGALAGGTDATTIYNSYATGSVNAGSGRGGGLVGSIDATSRIINSYASNSVFSGIGYAGA